MGVGGASPEDIHMAVEKRLREKLGPLGGKLHTGRSRNDQVALDLRLYVKAAGAQLLQAVSALESALISRAEEHLDTVMPGYTHTQRAQPVLLAHHLLAYVEMLGPKARPATRNAILASAARMDLKAFAALRADMAGFDGLAAAQKHPGPRFAIEAEGEDNPRLASHLPATKRIAIPGVSHWLMLDDPDATLRAFEEVLS